MRRFVSFLKDAFAAPAPQFLPSTSAEMTLHDALRICARPTQSRDGAHAKRKARQQIDICRYESESDLLDHWHCLDVPQQAENLTVILVLGEFLRSNLGDIIRRRWLAPRLVIVPRVGHWPGIDSFGDLALSARSRGWNSIERYSDLRDALLACTTRCQHGYHLVILPSRTPVLQRPGVSECNTDGGTTSVA